MLTCTLIMNITFISIAWYVHSLYVLTLSLKSSFPACSFCCEEIISKLLIIKVVFLYDKNYHGHLVSSTLVRPKVSWKFVSFVHLLCDKSSIWIYFILVVLFDKNCQVYLVCLALVWQNLSWKSINFIRLLYSKSITQIKFVVIASCMTRLPLLFGLFDSCMTKVLLKIS